MTSSVLSPPVSVADYLGASYHPDVDFVDGFIEDRHVGEIDHARLQRALLFILARMEGEGKFLALQELRVQVTPTRFRVPDLCVLPADRLPDRIVTDPPLLCIEVLSPEDTFSRTQTKCRDYLDMGVPEVWIFDPETRSAFVMTRIGLTEYRSGSLSLGNPLIQVDIDEVFSVLPRR